MNLNTKILHKKIKLVITDVDGVLTDGGMYYSDKGEIMKKFNTRDGMAVEILKNQNIKIIFMTREKSKLVQKRAEKVKITDLYMDVKDKASLLPKICKKFSVTLSEILYIGDDINDIEIMEKVGFSACPKNAVSKVKKISNYICKNDGGSGVLREITDEFFSKK